MHLQEFFRPYPAQNPRSPPGKPAPHGPNVFHLSSDLVLSRRGGSRIWQCRFKLRDGTWHRLSTGCADIGEARQKATELKEQWDLRDDAGLPTKRVNFSVVANGVIDELRSAGDAGRWRVVYGDYITVLERYLIPFFGRTKFEAITPALLSEFDGWRISQLGRAPKASTLRTHASAFNRVIEAAKSRGLLPLNRPAPSLSIEGERSQPRANFDQPEIDRLLAFLPDWAAQGRLAIERLIRPLLRDYVEFLLYTGVRHGTEARRLEWRHLQWHRDAEHRYLRIWVSGKTGPRYLIAKHGAVHVLNRLATRNLGVGLDQVIEQRLARLVFVCQNGYEPHGFEGSFRRLMRDSGLLSDASGKSRTLYSLRHTYATFALRDGISIHTVARQMGTSVLMLERHYSKLTPMMNAAELAG